MEGTQIEHLAYEPGRWRRWRKRASAEWCFVQAVLRHRGASLLILALLLVAGGACFRAFEPEKHHSFVRSMYFTWSLVFAQPPEEFPHSPWLQILFFVTPILGLTVIIEAIVEISQMVRDRRRNEETWCRIMSKSMQDHIVIVGLGRLGVRIYHLLRKLGHEVVVIERNPDAQFLDDARRDGAPIFVGDARRERWLEDANIRAARSIVLATNDDLSNLEVALDARRLNPKIRVVLRMFDPNMADKVRDGFQIRSVLSATSLASPAFAMAAIESGIVQSSIVGDQLVVTQRWPVEAASPLVGMVLVDVMREYHVGVLSWTRPGRAALLFPPPDTRLASGDELLIQGEYSVIEKHPIMALP